MLFRFKRQPKTEKFKQIINGESVDVFVYYENRMNARISIGKKGIYMRMPLTISEKRAKQFVENGLVWAQNKLKHKQGFSPTPFPTYKQGQILKFFDGAEYVIGFRTHHGNTNRIGQVFNKLVVELGIHTHKAQHNEVIAKKIREFVAKRYQPIIAKRLHEINNHYKLGTLNRVVLRNSVTNWGSCNHHKGYINVSLRLLLAPKAVVDAVLVHELCHLVHPNHSKSFWSLVYQIFPEYKQANQWLKQNGHKCKL